MYVKSRIFNVVYTESLCGWLSKVTRFGDGFAHAKYYRGDHFVMKSAKSLLSDSIASHEPCLRSIGQWIVGRGHVSFWSDNWLGDILHGLLPCDIKLTVQEALPMVDQFLHYIPTHLEDKARDTFLSIYQIDQLKFFLTEDGEFSSKFYMDLLHPPGCKRSWAELVWHNFLPPKVTTFMWKFNLLPSAVAARSSLQN